MAEVALVTGGAGFLGTHLISRLLEQGWEVHSTSRSLRASESRLLTFHPADLADLDTARRLVEKIRPQAVCHLAGSVGASPNRALVLETYHSHVTSTLNLLSLADDLEVRRLVLTGSLLEPTGDIAKAVPSSPYAAAKVTTTLYARMFHQLYGTPVVLTRPFMTFGPGQHPQKVVPYVIRSLSQGISPQLSSASWRADWIYVSDVVDALVSALTTADIDGAEMELGRGELKSVREVATAIHRLMKTDVPLRFQGIDDRPSAPEVVADTSTARRLLSWTPRVDLEEGLTRTIGWYVGDPK